MRTKSVKVFGRGKTNNTPALTQAGARGASAGFLERGWLAIAAPALLMGLGLLLSARAMAQTAAAPSPAAKASPAVATAPPQSVEEITVTAQKREQLSQDVPIALSAFSAQSLEFRQIKDLGDLQMAVPGFIYATSGIDQEIYIRGVGVDDVTGNLEAPIATYVNGVYQSRTTRINGLGGDDLELERIEVLKGPQGTLFGKNATGGLINIVLKPPTDELTAAAKMGGGSYGSILTEGFVSGPLIKHILDIRLAGSFYRDEGWVINADNGKPINDHIFGTGRLALSFHPLDNLSLDYNLMADKMVGGITDLNGPTVLVGDKARQETDGGYILKPGDIFFGNNPWKSVQIGPLEGDLEDTQNDLTTKWDFAEWGYLKSVTGFQEHTEGNSSTLVSYPLDFQRHDLDDKTITQELNFGGNLPLDHNVSWLKGLGINWIVGAYYFHEDFEDRFGPYILYNKTIEGAAQGNEVGNSYSLFGDATISLPLNLSIFGGVRYTYDKKDLTQTITLHLLPFGANFPPPTTCNDVKFEDQSHNLSPRLGIGWNPNEALNFYVKYSEGYNAGGHYYNGCDNGYEPETLEVVEGGVKGRYFDGRLAFDLVGYYNDYKKFQYFKLFQVVSGVVNAPEAEMYGGEFHVEAIPYENVTADGNFSVMHSQYDRFHDGDEANPQFGVENLSGHQMTQAPNSTESIGLGYEWNLPWERILGQSLATRLRLGALRLRGEWYHTDFIIFRPYLKLPGAFGQVNGGDYQNPYSIFNFYATVPTEDDHWSLHFYAKNFTNTRYFVFGTVSQATGGGTGGMPPWFGGDLTYRF